jgi:hypothetical protein
MRKWDVIMPACSIVVHRLSRRNSITQPEPDLYEPDAGDLPVL